MAVFAAPAYAGDMCFMKHSGACILDGEFIGRPFFAKVACKNAIIAAIQLLQEKIDNARRHHDAIMDATPMDKFLPCDDHINMRIPTHAKKILNERADSENKTLSQYLIYCANLVALLQGKEPFLLVAPRGFFMKRAARMAKGG